jgi:KRAB domain-containing zinc finger protein
MTIWLRSWLFVLKHLLQVSHKNSLLSLCERIHTGIRPHVCEICGKSFAENCKLQEHFLTHTLLGGKPFKCEYCGKELLTKTTLQKHTKLHTEIDVKDFECHT